MISDKRLTFENRGKLNFDCRLSHPTLGRFKVSYDVAVGAWELDQQHFSFTYKAIVDDWLRPVVKVRGMGINRVFFVNFVVTVCYSTFGFGTWIAHSATPIHRIPTYLSLIGPAGVVESSLEALSSIADARVCSQNWFWFWDLKFCLEFVWAVDPIHRGADVGIGGKGDWVWLRLYVLLSFCRVKIMVELCFPTD
jgi:hypothetical protein